MARPLVLAHRGACRRAPENSLAAFAWARELGADGVELDVRRSSDGVLVVHHDPQVEGLGLLRALPFSEIRRHRPGIPTLVEALGSLEGLLVNIEIKCLPWEPDPDPEGEIAVGVVDLLHQRTGIDQVVVSSFDLATVGSVRLLDARVPTGWLTMGRPPAEALAATAARGAAWLHPDRVSALADPEGMVAQARELGVKLDVWTVDDPAEVRRLAAAGVDAIITNEPDVAIAALGG